MTPLLFHFLIFLFEFAKYILRPNLCIVSIAEGVHEKRNNTDETIKVFYVTD